MTLVCGQSKVKSMDIPAREISKSDESESSGLGIPCWELNVEKGKTERFSTKEGLCSVKSAMMEDL